MRVVIFAIMIFLAFEHASAEDFFTSSIEPILRQRCFECHSHQQKMRGGLALDSKSGWEQGGDSGPAIVVAKPDDSLLIQAVRWKGDGIQMPPDGKLPEAEVALLEEWITRGAIDPRVLEARHPNAANWWSLKSLVPPEVPMFDGATHPIDRFIRARLAERNIVSSPQADRRTLIRRVYFDLNGLPPSFEKIEAFVKDPDPLAYEHLVDQLLDSSRYGERWARHWLDTIHFAETHGCGHDLPREHAWRYRDYVIDALNSDKPYSRFIREQLAADHLFPDEPRLTAALGFLGAGVFDHSAYQTATTNFDYLDRDDMVTQTMGAFASTTANCARCHAHKFDPITQEDYYALQAVFAGIIEGDISFEDDDGIGRQRKRWQSLVKAADTQDKNAALAPENAAVIQDWEQQQGSPIVWTPFQYESFASIEGATLTRENDILISSGAKPDKETYVITATVTLPTITALRLDVIADPSLPMGGPGRQDNGNLTVTAFEAQLIEAGSTQPLQLTFSRATADFDQAGWTSQMAIDGNSATGWGIHPAVGKSHLAVFELVTPLALKADDRLKISIKQMSGNSHLVGRFKLSATNAPTPRVLAMPSPVQEALAIPASSRSEEQRVAIALYALRFIAREKLAKLPPPSQIYAAAKHADVLLAVGPGTPTDIGKPKPVYLLRRGEFDKPVDEVQSGALSAVDALNSRFAQAHAGDESERRAALANWLADDKNPLTWRSMANRVWHFHFGRGLCDSPNDFGRMGGTPSHPELLDWLACELRDRGGSLKHLHRLIVTSATYRQSSEHRQDAAALDGDNRLMWRMNRLRLDADSYRDYVLAVSDRLDAKMHGPSVRQFITGPPVQLTPTLNYLSYDWASLPKHRRSIYRFVWRGVPDPFMDALDFPDLGMLAPARSFSASALQSLALYNNPFVLHFSGELGKQFTTPAESVRRILLREPESEEEAALTKYADQYGIAALCRLLINSNEFLFVE